MFGVFDPNMEFTFYITRHTYSFNKDFLTIAMIKQSVENQTCPEAYSGGALGVKPPPLGPVKSIDFRGFSAPPGKRKKFKPPLDKFLNTPLDLTLYKLWVT